MLTVTHVSARRALSSRSFESPNSPELPAYWSQASAIFAHRPPQIRSDRDRRIGTKPPYSGRRRT